MEKMVLLVADSNGSYPIPAVNGGAVSTLVEHLIQDNERTGLYDLWIVSFYNVKAKKSSKMYKNTNFIWIKVPKFIKIGDEILFKTIKKTFPNKKAISYKSIFSLLFYIFKARGILGKNEFDKILIENNIPLSLSLIGISKKYSGKYYYHFHNVPRINAWSKSIISKAAGYLCVSDYVGKQIEKDDNPIGPVPMKKVKTLRNCIDVQLFNEDIDTNKVEDIRIKHKLLTTDKVILFTGRISEEKGIDKVIKAFKIVHEKDKSLKLLIVGSYLHGSNIKDSYRDYLDKLSTSLKNKIVYTGYINQSDLKYYYQIAKVSVLPSMWDEPAGLTMLESMACGTPVITTCSGGIPEYVQDKAIVLKRDRLLVKKIATKIEYLLENPVIYQEYVNNGRKFVVNEYSSRGYINKLNKFIK